MQVATASAIGSPNVYCSVLWFLQANERVNQKRAIQVRNELVSAAARDGNGNLLLAFSCLATWARLVACSEIYTLQTRFLKRDRRSEANLPARSNYDDRSLS